VQQAQGLTGRELTRFIAVDDIVGHGGDPGREGRRGPPGGKCTEADHAVCLPRLRTKRKQNVQRAEKRISGPGPVRGAGGRGWIRAPKTEGYRDAESVGGQGDKGPGSGATHIGVDRTRGTTDRK
jgi:hypothetical protein